MTTTDWRPSKLQLEREAYRRAQRRRARLVAVASTVVFVLVVGYVVTSSSGWDRTRDSFFDLRTGWTDVPDQLRALWINVQIMLISEVFILVLGGLLAVARTLPGPLTFPLRLFATIYVDLFRGIPLLIMLFLVGFGLPSLRLSYAPTSLMVLCIIALVMTYSAYVAEVFRAGIQSVHPSQSAAARSLGLTHGQTMRYVVLPQAVRRVLPPLLNDFVSLQKDTSLVSILGVIDIVQVAGNEQSSDFKFVHFVVAALIFVALTIPLTRLTDWIAHRQGWVGVAGMIR